MDAGNPSMAQDDSWIIGNCEVRTSLDEVRRDGATFKLEPRATRVFTYLAERAPEVVSVQELLDAVWKDLMVTQDSVYTAIAALRRALGDDGENHAYILNVPRRGYRLAATVRRWSAPVPELPATDASVPALAPPPAPPKTPFRRMRLLAVVCLAAVLFAALILVAGRLRRAPPSPEATVAAGIPEASIAVLPFVDLSEKHDQSYFSDGLSEELIDQLSQIEGLRVPARRSSFYFRDQAAVDVATIARRLRVTHVLEGSVRRAGNQIRVTAQLVRADSGYQLWSQTYDRELKDIFQVQDEISAAVVTALKLRLSAMRHPAVEHPSNIEAYQTYLRARQALGGDSPDAYQRAADLYRKAVALAPDYAAAYAGLALAEGNLADHDGDSAAFEDALQMASRAIQMAPDQASGYTARSFLKLIWSDWSGAEQDTRVALSIDLQQALVLGIAPEVLASTGHLDEAIAYARQGVELDPLSANAWLALGVALLFRQQPGAAQDALQHGLVLEPRNPHLLVWLGYMELISGHASAARDLFRQNDVSGWRLQGVALAEFSLGHIQESNQALDELIAQDAGNAAFQIADVYAWRGERDRAFDWFQRALKQRDGGFAIIRYDPLLKSLRSDPRFSALLKQLKISE
jgi:TolB-like protein/DNA-binding winged helix-turn-helix (wHTH) protein